AFCLLVQIPRAPTAPQWDHPRPSNQTSGRRQAVAAQGREAGVIAAHADEGASDEGDRAARDTRGRNLGRATVEYPYRMRPASRGADIAVKHAHGCVRCKGKRI